MTIAKLRRILKVAFDCNNDLLHIDLQHISNKKFYHIKYDEDLPTDFVSLIQESPTWITNINHLDFGEVIINQQYLDNLLLPLQSVSTAMGISTQMHHQSNVHLVSNDLIPDMSWNYANLSTLGTLTPSPFDAQPPRPKINGMCKICGVKDKIKNLIPITMTSYACADCAESHFKECSYCVKLFKNDEGTIFDDKPYCSNCTDSYIFACYNCKEVKFQENVVYTSYDGNRYCNSCVDTVLIRCERCSRIENKIFLQTCLICQQVSCRDCSDSHEDNCGYRELTKVVFYKGKKEKSSLPFDRFVGVEIEAERGNISKLVQEAPKEVGIGHDGSLDDRGVEIQTPPANYDELERLVKQSTSALKKSGYKGTIKCGLHLHFDARDIKKDYQKITQVVKTFYALEDIIYSMLPPSRWDAKYCQQLNRDYLYDNFKKKLSKREYEKVWYKEDRGFMIDERKRHKYDATRYYGLNIHSIFYRNTIELRYHSGTVEDYKILHWIDFTGRIIDYAINHYNEKEVRYWFDLATNYNKLDRICSILKIPRTLHQYIIARIDRFNPNCEIKFNKGKEVRASERRDIKKKQKAIESFKKTKYPDIFNRVQQECGESGGIYTPRDIANFVDRETRIMLEREKPELLNLPADGGFIKKEEIKTILRYMKRGRDLSVAHEGNYDEPEI